MNNRVVYKKQLLSFCASEKYSRAGLNDNKTLELMSFRFLQSGFL